MAEKKPCYTIENFPFDLLRVGANDEKGYITNKFGSAHQMIYVEIEPGIYKEFEIERPPMPSNSFNYWYEGESNAKKPNFYLHMILHPKWGDRDKSGEVSKTTGATGLKVAAFLDNFENALKRELRKMKDDDLEVMMGYDRAHDNKWIEPIAQHPKHEKGHKRANLPNTDKSPSWKTALWIQDRTKKAENAGKNQKNQKPKKGNSGVIQVPDTNIDIFTKFYDTSVNKNNKEPAGDYQDIKKLIYKPDAHPNSAPTICDMLSSGKLLTPSILWKPGDNAIGKVQFKILEHVTMVCNPRSYSRELSDEKATEIENAKARAMEEFGMVQEEPKEENEKKRPVSAISSLLYDNRSNKKKVFRSDEGGSTSGGDESGKSNDDDDPDEDIIRMAEETGQEAFNQ